jgi:hypothetical protein
VVAALVQSAVVLTRGCTFQGTSPLFVGASFPANRANKPVLVGMSSQTVKQWC